MIVYVLDSIDVERLELLIPKVPLSRDKMDFEQAPMISVFIETFWNFLTNLWALEEYYF